MTDPGKRTFDAILSSATGTYDLRQQERQDIQVVPPRPGFVAPAGVLLSQKALIGLFPHYRREHGTQGKVQSDDQQDEGSRYERWLRAKAQYDGPRHRARGSWA
jgi:hypothetical protein